MWVSLSPSPRYPQEEFVQEEFVESLLVSQTFRPLSKNVPHKKCPLYFDTKVLKNETAMPTI